MTDQAEIQNSANKPAASDFTIFITRMCNAQQWKVTESDSEHVVIQFSEDGNRAQTVFIFSFDNSLEFSVPSFGAFDSLDSVPHLISTTLLQINAKTKLGFWCLEQIGEKLVYTYMHNTFMKNVDEEIFREIVISLIQRVEEFEGLLIKMSDAQSSNQGTAEK